MSARPAVIVAGGAGYIGSHVCLALSQAGFLPVAFDDLSAGYEAAVQWGPLVRGDIRDAGAVRDAALAHGAQAAIGLAGLIEVGRSMSQPDVFYDINVAGMGSLLAGLRDAGVGRLVFSSSAAVYGATGAGLLREDDPKAPTSVYGETKLVGEWMIASHCRAFGLSAVALRYFNAAGADPEGRLGEAHDPETHLIPLAIRATLGLGPPLTVFGTDFDTPDGSCLRDYVHVRDLAAAHVAALRAPLSAGAFEAVNVGVGQGRSVLEVIQAVEAAAGQPTPHSIGPRRAGDPASLVADPSRAHSLLGWRAERSDLADIVADALAWHRAQKYGAHASQATKP